jgi:hypothetical protein
VLTLPETFVGLTGVRWKVREEKRGRRREEEGEERSEKKEERRKKREEERRERREKREERREKGGKPFNCCTKERASSTFGG